MRATLENHFYKLAGVAFLFLAKAKHTLKGYTTPRPFSVENYRQAFEYDVNVVTDWLSYLARHTDGTVTVEDKEVLEVGPGADLGVGLYLLHQGAKRYNAIDVHNLVETVPREFYDSYFRSLVDTQPHADATFLQDQLDKTRNNKNDRLNYICREDFDITADIPQASIDIVFSQAAFEHFDDIEETIRQLSWVAKPGAVIVAEIDLMTHSRWIRDKDPNNIYRYSRGFYDLFSFKGRPNRERPWRFKELFQKYGWRDISITPLTRLDRVAFTNIQPHLNGEFRHDRNQMDYLDVMLCGTKS